VNLQSDDFDLFGLSRSFAQDRAALDTAWKALQRQAHPDKFAAEGAAAQRLAMQWSVRINEAHQRLKNPLKRAAYLCELRGSPIRAHDNTAMPAEFLMQQILHREALEEAESPAALEALADEIQAQKAQLLEQLEASLDQQADAAQAAQQVRALMFVERFAQEIDARIDQICA
jgi:molecular chaperone HscB